MKKVLSVLTSAILLLFLFSCVTVETLPGLGKIYVTNTKQINLLSPDNIAEPVEQTIQLEIKMNDSSLFLLVFLQADENIIFADIMNDFMISMGTLQYDGSTIEFDCPAFPASLKPEYILNDLQNVYYKTSALSKNLAASKLIFEEETDSSTKIRRIKDGKKVIEEITFEENTVIIKNVLRKYEFCLIYE